MSPTRPPRLGNLYLWASLVLFAAFAGIAVGMWYALQNRFVVDARLLGELADSESEDQALPPTAGWPQWRGARRDGIAFSGPLLTDWPKGGPPELWSHDISDNEGYSSFAVVGDRVFTMSKRDAKEVILCWKIEDGTELWRAEYEPRRSGSIDYGNGPRSTPAYFADRVYTVGATGQFQCRQADDGKLLWEHDLRAEYNAPLLKWGIAFSPLVDGDLVYTMPGGGNGKSLVAFDRLSGAEVWTSQNDAPGYSSPIAVTVDGERQIVFFTARHLVGVDARKGTVRWRTDWVTEFDVNAATPIVFHAKFESQERTYVFITSGYRRGCELLTLVREESGGYTARRVFESKRLCSHFGTPVRVGAYLYGFNETVLVCLSLRTGEVMWEKKGYKKGSLLAVGEHLLVLGEEGQLALLKATPDKAEVVVEAARVMGRRCWTMPVLADGRLFLRDEDKVRCLDLRKR